ncbi:Maf family protein [Stomatohabitans albus]|uniref:Maf family protein n=1 Tax=Stomatohabitans albus TaxID=3110766 RepID=UPI00300D9651
MSRLILASASPRRHDLLVNRLGLTVDVQVPDVDETPQRAEAPVALVQRLAKRKAEAVTADADDVVIAADTLVIVDGDILGKPATPDEATSMLRRLNGTTHSVLTAVCVRHDERYATGVERSHIRIRRMSNEEIDWYVNTGEPMDKAGGYAVQGIGGIFVEHVDGSETAVIGLPLAQTHQLVSSLGADLMAFRTA